MATTQTNEPHLTPAQRDNLLVAKAWWQEGERALDYLAEHAEQQALLAGLRPLFARLRADPSADTVAPLVRLTRQLAPNPTLNRTRETSLFAGALRDLLFGEATLPARLAAFLGQTGVGAQTASQMLLAAFPDRFPLVSPATRAPLALTPAQRAAARAHVVARYELAGGNTPPAVLALLADFAWYEAVRALLDADDFVIVNAVLTCARQMPARSARRRRNNKAATAREEPAGYETAAEATEQDLLDLVEGTIEAQGFTFPPLAVRNYYVALKTKPFVILAGLSGTGKTRLTRLLADALTGGAAASEQYLLLPVRPDWTDGSPLLGYHNLLTDRYVSTPFLDLLTRAGQPENRERAFFVCLDEMNLARVEHYFADLLSAMETPERTLALHEQRTLTLPFNVFLTGSVNVDEAAFPFSKKVLDRANTIEFSDVNFAPFGAEAPRRALPTIAPPERQRLFLSSRAANVGDAQQKLAALDPGLPDRVINLLSGLNVLLRPRGLHLGYRIRDEVLCYLANAFDAAGNGLLALGRDDNILIALDLQIVQKALPRVSGTPEALAPLLRDLDAWALAGGFFRAQTKITAMRSRAALDGFVSFYEP